MRVMDATESLARRGGVNQVKFETVLSSAMELIRTAKTFFAINWF
jgi:hypothetical protein